MYYQINSGSNTKVALTIPFFHIAQHKVAQNYLPKNQNVRTKPPATNTQSATQTDGEVLGTSFPDPSTPVAQVLGITTSAIDPNYINQLIDNRFNQYLAEGKFEGLAPGFSGPNGMVQNNNGQTTSVIGGTPIVSYYQPAPSQNFNGGSLAGITELSANNFSVGNNTNLNILNVTGAATLSSGLTVSGSFSAATSTISSLTVSGFATIPTISTTTITSLTVSGPVTFTGSTTIAGLTVSGLNPGLTIGSVAFQNSSGLTQDNSNFFYDATNHRFGLGTSTPSQLLTVAGNTLVTGNSTTTGNSVISSNQLVSGSLNVTGQTALGNSSTSALTVNGATVLVSAATLQSTLNVTGQTTFTTASGTSLTLGGALVANTFNGNIISAGTGTLTLNSNTLALQGGNTTLIGSNTITVSTIATSTIATSTISGLLASSSTLNNSVINNLTAAGNGYSLFLFGTSSINQSVTTTSTPTFAGLTINGNSTTTGNLIITGNQTVTGNLTVNGTSQFATSTISNLTVTNTSTLNTLIASGAVQFTNTATLATSTIANLTVTNTSTLSTLIGNGNVTFTGNSTFATTTIAQLTVTGNSQFNGNATTTGNYLVQGALSVTGTSTLATTTITNLTVTQAPTVTAFNSAGVVHNSSSGLLSTSLIVNADITAGTIASSKLVGTDIATVGTLTAGSIASGFGTINSGAITSSGALALGSNTITSGNINGQTISSAANFTGTLAVTATSTLATTTITNLTLSQVLGVASGGTGTNTLASLTVGTNLSITGGQKVLIGTSTQISISANPSFTSITATATSSLGSASSTALTVSGPTWITGTATLATTSVTALTANTFNGLTLNVGTGTLTLNSNTLALQGGNTTLIGANSISTSTISQIILNGNSNTLSLFGNSNINQNLMTTSTPSFAGLTINGNSTTTGSSVLQGPLSVTAITTQLTLSYNAGNYWSSTVASTGGLTFDGNGSSTNFTVKMESSSVTDNYSSQNKIASSYNVAVSLNNLQLGQSTSVCGSYSVTGIDGFIYGTVVGADGQCWLDRNLGATEVAASSIDTASYGFYYQWGRAYDGHQVSNSTATTTLSSTATPGHNNFIEAPSSPYDWVSPQINTLWQSPSYTNNPCPSGFYPPTQTQWATLVTAAGITNSATAFSSSLKLPLAGYRYYNTAALSNQGSNGFYWSSRPSGTNAYSLDFNSSSVNPANGNYRAYGFSVRCVKD